MKDEFSRDHFTHKLREAVNADLLDMAAIIEAVEGGACLNMPDDRGYTSVMILACNEETEAVEYLLSQGALVSTCYMTQEEVVDAVYKFNYNDDMRSLLQRHREDDTSAEAQIIRKYREDYLRSWTPSSSLGHHSPSFPPPPQL